MSCRLTALSRSSPQKLTSDVYIVKMLEFLSIYAAKIQGMEASGENQTAPAEGPTESRHRKNKFTSQEDQHLVALVEQHGIKQWDVIAKSLPGRTARQCRDRWKNYLAPNVNQMPWTREEDQRLLHLYRLIGPRWSKMGSTFPGRTSVSVKNRWHKLRRMQTKLIGSVQPLELPTIDKPPQLRAPQDQEQK